jgi:hypothetical protein
VYYVIVRDANSQCCQRAVIRARWLANEVQQEKGRENIPALCLLAKFKTLS